MNDLSPAQCILLWQAVEDYSGLWECPWELRAINPSASDEDLRMEAAKIVAELLSMELVELYYCQEPYGEMSKIPDTKAAELLGNDDIWAVPAPEALSVRFSATNEGTSLVVLP
ncbi:hypothetical protein J2T11_000153 [Paenarthrobacter nicotinovorans]|uniref:hypothetical protein n=1 Tax=Paenarthrobacter nicotinovorans TaxID=29320 RepID=UPI002789673A|nr:hypothetical protein [Paenarthrobacter nicotinovorans]MDP9933829.1 hypothetical protein [Paenarthrobacter nicotinovorans]